MRKHAKHAADALAAQQLVSGRELDLESFGKGGTISFAGLL